MTWLITGGAGYIGAHVARAMTAAGRTGRRPGRPLRRDPRAAAGGRPAGRAARSWTATLLDRVLAEHAVTGVVHLAAKKQVGESVEQPLRYYRENVAVSPRSSRRSSRRGAALPVLLLRRRLRRARTWTSSPRTARASRSTRTARPSWRASGWSGRRAARTACPPPVCATSMWRARPAGAGRHRRLQHHPDVLRPAHPRRGPADLRRRLPDAGRHLHPRLHPRRRPRRRPSRGRPPPGRRGATGADLTVNIGRGEGVSVRELADLVGEITGTTSPPRRRAAPARRPAACRRLGRASPRSWAGRPGAACGRWSSRPGRAGACCTPRPADPAALLAAALTCDPFPQVRAHDNGVQCRVAPYPPPVVHLPSSGTSRWAAMRGRRAAMGAGHDHGQAHGAAGRRHGGGRVPGRLRIALSHHAHRDGPRDRRRSARRLAGAASPTPAIWRRTRSGSAWRCSRSTSRTGPPTENRTFGFARAEILAALANCLLLLGVGGYLLFEAVERFIDPGRHRGRADDRLRRRSALWPT